MKKNPQNKFGYIKNEIVRSSHCAKYARLLVFNSDLYSLNKDRVYNSVLIRENLCQWKHVFSHIWCNKSSYHYSIKYPVSSWNCTRYTLVSVVGTQTSLLSSLHVLIKSFISAMYIETCAWPVTKRGKN